MDNNKKNINNNNYDDDSIRVLEGLKAVRERPGMYVGSSGSKGLHHLIWEILDNSVDEILAGYANTLTIIMKPDNVITIIDNGRGIPTGINKQTKVSNLETVFTILHAGGKFENSTYKMSGGLHGVGATCVNALSKFFEVTVYRGGEEHFARFVNGGNVDVSAKLVNSNAGKKTGTSITWQPDFEILEKNDYDLDLIKERLKTLAYLNQGAKFIYINENTNEKQEYIFANGIKDWVELINKGKQPLHEIIHVKKNGKVKNRKDEFNDITINIAFQYVLDGKTEIFNFCNNISTTAGGTHLESFKDGILTSIRNKAVEAKIVKNPYDIIKTDILNGLCAIVSIYYTNPEYEGQTKGILSNSEIKSFIKDEIFENFNRFLEENPKEKEIILAHIEREFNLRVKLELTKQSERQLAHEGFLSYAGKLADCSIKNVEFSELYIVEGDSAGGSAKSARSREFQAILPIKGKLINVEKNRNLHLILNNTEIKSLISAIGCSHSQNFDLTKLRYNKLILMTDADVDGAHIRVLLLTFIYKYMAPLVEHGHVFIAQPPLYRASSNKDVKYIFDDKELQKFKNKEKGTSNYEINRFKGLGEMSPEQLWETTMNPATRTLLKVEIADLIMAEKTFNKLMGKNVEPRKNFIISNYKNIKNLDI